MDFPKEYTDKVKADKGLFLFGPRGVGKTHFIAAMMKDEIMQTGLIKGHIDGSVREPCWIKPFYKVYPLFINVPEFLLKIRGTWNHSKTDTSEQEILDNYGSTKILYLDDLGAEKASDWAISTLYLLINRRYESELRTVISSNLSLDELAANLDDRISSRIAGMSLIVKMEGSDRRLKK